jgi:hypothetical protein
VPKHKINLKQTLMTLALVLLVFYFLTSTMLACAITQSITLYPNYGLPNSKVVVSGYGFAAGVPVTITFNGETVATTQGYSLYNQLPATEFRVPEVDFGTYNVTATNKDGSVTVTYTVGNSEPSPTPTPTITPSPSPTLAPTNTPTSSPTSKSTDAPTQNPTSTPHTSANPSPTPTVPEYQSTLGIAFLFTITLLGAIILREKPKEEKNCRVF